MVASLRPDSVSYVFACTVMEKSHTSRTERTIKGSPLQQIFFLLVNYLFPDLSFLQPHISCKEENLSGIQGAGVGHCFLKLHKPKQNIQKIIMSFTVEIYCIYWNA